MNPLAYCLQQAAPAGSPNHYALRLASERQREVLLPLYALHAEIGKTTHLSRDPGVAAAKLTWWRQELRQAEGGQASHPICRSLQQATSPRAAVLQATADRPALSWLGYLVDMLDTWITGHLADLEQARYLNADALLAHLAATDGVFHGIVAACCTRAEHRPPHEQSERDMHNRLSPGGLPVWATALGTALGLANTITEIGEYARHGRIYLPVDDMQSHDVPAADLINRRYSANFTALMQAQRARAKTALLSAQALAPSRRSSPPRAIYRCLIAEAAMASRLLDEIEREHYQILHQRIALTPVRNLLIAWWATR